MESNLIAIIGLSVSVASFVVGRYGNFKKKLSQDSATWTEITLKLEIINETIEKVEKQVQEINVALINSTLNDHNNRLNILERDYKDIIKSR